MGWYNKDLWPSKKGVFYLGFIGSELRYSDVPVAPAFCHAKFPVGN